MSKEKYLLNTLWIWCLLFGVGCKTSNTLIENSATSPQVNTISFQSIYADPLENLYALDSHGILHRLDKDFNPIFSFQNKRLGNITHVSVDNPYKIVVFYYDQQVVILLDDTLQDGGEYRLQDWNIPEVSAIYLSTDNQFWYYDRQQFRLNKIGLDGNLFFEGRNLLSERITDLEPYMITENEDYVYLLDKQNGIVRFSSFGNYIDKKEIDDSLQLVQIFDQKLIFFSDQNATMQSFDRAYSKSIKWENKILDIKIGKTHYWVLDDEGIHKLPISTILQSE